MGSGYPTIARTVYLDHVNHGKVRNMSQQANRYRPRTRAGIRTAITAREMAHEVYRYTRKAAS